MDFAAELVAHHGARRHSKPVLDGVQIGTADSTVVDLEYHLAGARIGLGHVRDRHLVLTVENRRSHRESAPSGLPAESPAEARAVTQPRPCARSARFCSRWDL